MTLKVIKTDENRDPVIRSGKYVFVYAAEAAAQVIASTVRVQVGEYQYDQTKGVDYFGNVFLGNPNFQKFEYQVREQVKALSFVEKIASFEYTLDNNILSYTMVVKTIYGLITVAD
jgi:hypothetical protein